jgi:hypothetical protein
MEIVLLAVLFLVGTVASAVQALKYLDRKRLPRDPSARQDGKSP